MSDISSFWDIERLVADWREGKGDLINGNDLQTAIIISLFTDRVARDDDVIDGDDRRGWWGDLGEEHNIGSRLWLLRRKKLDQSVAQKAEDYVREALQWLITDGVVLSVTVATQIVYPRQLNLVISYQKPGSRDDTDMRFFWVWE
ncbi:putative phage protein GP46 [Serratia symbiotica str. Tucson]|uniref:Phage protein GP46 n=2 Tax=Serratia symbiotica TaxID=138074 RepID=A0A455VIC3_9GAMM|nr:phage GP46 family protein [Serratia symbiotica]EFW12747.1 putative phage protein GP46 [Serratia symbiotica str. Tucson]BBI92813.1 phage protein GP46 [Serratia symbiotica]